MERAGLPEDHALWAAERQIQRDNLLAKVELQERLLVVPTDPHNRRPTHPHNHHALTRTHIHPHQHQYSHIGQGRASTQKTAAATEAAAAYPHARTHARTHLRRSPLLFPHAHTAEVSSRSHDLGSPRMILGRPIRFRLGSADSFGRAHVLARQQAEDAGFRQVLLGSAEAVFKHRVRAAAAVARSCAVVHNPSLHQLIRPLPACLVAQVRHSDTRMPSSWMACGTTSG